MMRLPRVLALLLGCLTLVLAACAPPLIAGPDDEGVTLVLAHDGSRTILPGLPAGSTYVVTIDQPGQATKTYTLSDLSTPITDLFPGPATVSVEVRDASGTLLAKADPQDVTVGFSLQPDVGIVLIPVTTGTGDVNLNISWPLSQLTSIHAYLYRIPVGGSPTSVAPWMTPPSPFTTTSSQALTATSIPSGSYLLKIDLQGSGVVFPSYTRVVQIWPGLSTSAPIALSLSDFTEIPAPPSNIQFIKTGGVVTMIWLDNSDTEEGFHIYDNVGAPLINTGAGINLVSITTTDMMVRWSVSAFNSIGESTRVVPSPRLFYVADTVAIPATTWIPVGGALPAAYPPSLPAHSVASLRGFDLGRTEVTYRQWSAVYDWATALDEPYVFSHAGTNSGANSNFPVVSISWRDAMLWCNALSEAEGLTRVYYTDAGFTTALRSVDSAAFDATPGTQDNPYILKTADGYRLPTEAEWEAAARYVSPGVWNDSDRASGAPSNAIATAQTYGWFWPNTMHEVALAPSNALGLFDMSGNAMEWVQDRYNGDYSSGDDYTSPDTLGPTVYGPWNARVTRGGSIYLDLGSNPEVAGASHRSNAVTDLGQLDLGFRVARGALDTRVASVLVTSLLTTFLNPTSLTLGPSGHVLVLGDQGAGTVTGIDASGNVVENFSAPIPAHGLAFVGGAAYSGLTTTIQQFVGPWPVPTVGALYGATPTDVSALTVNLTSLGAVTRGPGPDDTLLIINETGGSLGDLRLMNLTLNTVTTLVSGETVNTPKGLLYDPVMNQIYLADTGNSIIKVYSTGGTFLKTFNGTGISGPIGLAVDPTGGTLYVANSVTGDITLVDTTSATPGTKAKFSVASGLSSPHGVVLAPDGSLYIADAGNNRVIKISP